MKTQISLSLVVLILWIGFGAIWSRVLPQLQGISAAHALNDDTVAGNAISLWFRNSDPVGLLIFVAVVVLLLWIWLPQVKKALKNVPPVAMLLVALTIISAACTNRAVNESEKNQSADVVEIQPNQTAFVIPATGGNFSDQEQFKSLQYLDSRKVAAKRITLEKDNVGGKYVTRDIVVLVDRTPLARQWTKSDETGTSSANQALCAESNESIEVCMQISMSASVREADASKYLYNFPTTKLQNPQVSSVYTAAALEAVVDNQIRQYLQSLLGGAVGSRSLDDVIKEKAMIVREASKSTTSYFAEQGITIAYIGLGGELGLDPAVQKVINDKYIAIAQATVTSINANAARRAAEERGAGDAAAMADLYRSVGGNATALGAALEGYRWNGSRVTVNLGSDNTPSFGVTPQGSPIPMVPAQRPVAIPAPMP